MAEAEIDYDKYRRRGDYHWRQISCNPIEMSAYVLARYRFCIELYEAYAGSLRNKKVIDFGCGDAAFTWLLVQKGAEVVGIDPAHEAIVMGVKRHREKRSNAIFCVANGYAAPFQDGQFDAVISTDVIEHVRDPRRFLSEIHRLLKPGGWAIISTPIRLTEKPLDRMHVVEWFPMEFRSLVEEFFTESHWACSHPACWGEMSRRAKLLRIIINLVSIFWKNPFLQKKKWSLFELQYAIVKKSSDG